MDTLTPKTTRIASDRPLKKDAPLSLTTNCVKVLEARYLKKDKTGKIIETPAELFRRVAHAVVLPEYDYNTLSPSEIEELEDKFYDVMTSGRFMPNSPTLMNAGREMGMLSACFVLPVEDSIDGIFTSIKNTALIQKAGGGTGFDFSELRPSGDIVTTSGGTTSGPLSFLQVFSKATDAIQQGAFRRGANMGMMSITHPDIMEFINFKEDLTRLTNYNISVSMPDDVMKDIVENPSKIHMVTNPRTGESFPLAKKGEPGKFWTLGEIFNVIVTRAWNTGEPGLIFIDRINRDNPTPHIGRMTATNPCGEQPLLPYEACNLGSIDVNKFVKEDEHGQKAMDWDAFRETIHLTTRYLDNVVDANNYPIPEITEMCHGNRKIGLGVMGFADALFNLGISYTSDEGVAFGEEIMKFIQEESHNASEKLAEEKGVFPNWKGSMWDKKYNRKMRNACTTTVAPTGTISIIASCSGGIEPLFSLAFFRNVLNGARLIEVNEYFKRVAKEKGFYSEELMKKIADEGTIQHEEDIPDEVKKVFVCAHDVEPDWHIKMQAAFQRHCDSSISKTTNFPEEATVEDVRNIYEMAFKYELKGITVYRDGCRKNQPMALATTKGSGGQEVPKVVVPAVPAVVKPITLPEIMSCLRIRQQTPFGNMHVKISIEPKTGIEREVFAQLGKGGDIANSDLEAVCRLLSLFLRSGGQLKQAMKQLNGIGSSLTVPSRDGRVMSLADGLAKAVNKYLKAKDKFGIQALLLGEVELNQLNEKKTEETAVATLPLPNNNGSSNGNGSPRNARGFKVKCPECQNELAFEEGCVKCHDCGYSQC